MILGGLHGLILVECESAFWAQSASCSSQVLSFSHFGPDMWAARFGGPNHGRRWTRSAIAAQPKAEEHGGEPGGSRSAAGPVFARESDGGLDAGPVPAGPVTAREFGGELDAGPAPAGPVTAGVFHRNPFVGRGSTTGASGLDGTVFPFPGFPGAKPSGGGSAGDDSGGGGLARLPVSVLIGAGAHAELGRLGIGAPIPASALGLGGGFGEGSPPDPCSTLARVSAPGSVDAHGGGVKRQAEEAVVGSSASSSSGAQVGMSKVVRLRRGGHPILPFKACGSRDKMNTIAVDPVATQAAVDKFNELIYAPSSAASKASRARLWYTTAAAFGIDPFPLTPAKVLKFAAVLKEAGYRSGYLYLVEAEQIHARLGHPLEQPLRLAMTDARRGLERGLGPPARSAEIRPEWLDELHAAVGNSDVELDRRDDSPRGGLFVWGLGTGWLLREIELSLLDLHADTLKIDDAKGITTLKLNSSKMDPSGRSASRTHRCSCEGVSLPSCPVCSARHLLELAMRTWGGNRDSHEAKLIPLIGTIARPHRFVEKQALVAAAQRDAELIRSMGVADVVPSEVTGHFMRRSGAKSWTRRGLTLASVQWLGRWGSAAVMMYVEEAAEEMAPGADHGVPVEVVRAEAAIALRCFPAQEELAGQVGLPALLGRPEVQQSLAEAGIAEDRLLALEQFASEARSEIGGARALAQELDELVRPSFVLNTSSEVLHRAVRTERLASLVASTRCGWRWARSPVSRPVSAEEVTNAGQLWVVCAKCS